MSFSRGWTFGEATLLRACALLHLLVLVLALASPATMLAPFGLPHGEPAVFLRVWGVAWGTLGFALLRAVRLPRGEGRLTVETVGLAKLGLFAVIVAEALAHRLPSRALLASVLDLVFGLALYRTARRTARREGAEGAGHG